MSKDSPSEEKKKTRQQELAEAVQPARSTDNVERATEEQARYDGYRDERKALVEGEQASADQFDKSILTLAGGALAISLIFLEKIVPEPKASTLPYLYCGWTALVVSLCAILASFLTSQHAYRRQRKIVEAVFFAEPGKEPEMVNSWGRWTSVLNWISILVFILGVSMLVVFSTENIRLKTIMNKPAPVATTGAANGQGSTKTIQ
jgi:hypothetical protein